MNDMIAKHIADKTSVSSEPPTGIREVSKASGLYVVHAMDDKPLPPVRRRGASRSWLPGAWGDPF